MYSCSWIGTLLVQQLPLNHSFLRFQAFYSILSHHVCAEIPLPSPWLTSGNLLFPCHAHTNSPASLSRTRLPPLNFPGRRPLNCCNRLEIYENQPVQDVNYPLSSLRTINLLSGNTLKGSCPASQWRSRGGLVGKMVNVKCPQFARVWKLQLQSIHGTWDAKYRR